MTTTPTTAPTRRRHRSGLTLFREPRRRPALAPAGWAVLCGLLLLALSALAGAAIGRAQEAEPGVRFTPSGRGTRPAVTRWRPLVEEYPWDAATALRVIDCESGGDPAAVNPASGAAGLLQLYGWGWLARRLFGTPNVLIPWVNVGTAFALWEDSGGRFGFHWYASMRCWS